MAECEFQARRVVRTYRQTIAAKPHLVFPLLCPVREAEWLDGWKCVMIYSASGLAEQDAVFSTASPAEEETVWVITRYDPPAGVIDFARFTPQSRTCVLRIVVAQCGKDASHVDVSYTYTSLGPSGDLFLDDWTEDSFLDAMVFWETSMNHFLKTKTRLSRQPHVEAESPAGKGA